MVKNLPVMQEIQVQSLGQKDPWEKGMATKSQGQRGPDRSCHHEWRGEM